MANNKSAIAEKQAKRERKRKILLSVGAGILALALILGIVLDSFMFIS